MKQLDRRNLLRRTWSGLAVVALVASGVVGCSSKPGSSGAPIASRPVPAAQGFVRPTPDGQHLSTQQAAFGAIVRVADGAFALSPAGALPASVQFATLGVSRGGLAQEFPGAQVVADGEGGVAIARGQVLERVQVLSHGLELNWTFPAAPEGTGDALVSLRMSGVQVTSTSAEATLLRSVEAGMGLRVGAARWVDASGAVTSIAQEVQGDVLTFRVPAALLEASRYPAVLDPVVSPATLGQVAFDAGVAAGTINWLRVGVSGPGSVTSDDGAVNCGATCAAAYTNDSVVTLTATATAGGARFTGWSGLCYGTNVCRVPMSKARLVYAYFEPATWPVKVVKVGGGHGAVTGAGIDCPATSATCTVQVPNTMPRTAVTFSAAADATSVFQGWSADCGGTGDCTLTVDRPKNAYATFAPSSYTVTVNVTGAAGSTVSGPGGFTCTGTCTLPVPFSATPTQLALTASPLADFIIWSGDCAGFDATCNLTVNGNKNVYASFQTKQPGSIGYYDPVTGAGGHFDAAAEAWNENSGSCHRCHTTGGFMDYVGYDGRPNYLERTFVTNTLTQTPGPLRCAACHNPAADPMSGRLSSVLFPSLARVDRLDGPTALCSQCHQGRESTPSVNGKITTNVASASRGLSWASTSANAAGTTTTLVRTGGNFLVDQFKGFTGIFTNNDNQGRQVTVVTNDSTTLTFTPAVTTATHAAITGGQPADAITLYPAATGGDIDGAFASKGTTMPAIDRGVSLVDTNRAWTANQWTGYYLYMVTGANAGLYRAITGNTATTLTVAAANLGSGMPFPAPVAAGDLYQILQKEDATGTGTLDVVSSSLTFSNIHYLPASATLHGADARMAYQSPTNWGNGTARVAAAPSYSGKNLHGVSADKCTSCHDAHTGVISVSVVTCGRCHFNEDGTPVASFAQLEEARQYGFGGDIDGSGTETSLKSEIDGLAALLLQGIENYATLRGGGAICYDGSTNPYWFKDNGTGGGTAANGVCETGEMVSANQYGQSGSSFFTPRLLRAAYDYQYYVKEPGAWAHNPRYVIQVLFDAIKDLNQLLPATTPAAGGQVGIVCNSTTLGRVAMNGDGTCPSGYTRTFAPQRSFASGTHFAGGDNAFRLRDTTASTAGQVGYPCLRCHAGEKGLEAFLSVPFFSDETAAYAAAVQPVQGMECTTCHDPLPSDGDMKRMRNVAATPAGGVRFPGYLASGTLLPASDTTVLPLASFGAAADMVCSSCHSSRDINGRALDRYLDGTWSGFDVPGSAFLGAGSVTNNGSGLVRLSGLPLYQAPTPKGTPNNWLYTTSCQAVGKFVTISGGGYGGTYAITACANGSADLNVAYSADASVSWSSWAAGTKNTHDIQSAARVYGGDAHVGYEYAGRTYAGRKQHHGATAACIECHSPVLSKHTMDVAETVAAGGCTPCHTGTAYTTWSAGARGLTTGAGYDGDAATQSLPAELASFRYGLAAAMNAYQRAAGVAQAGGNLCWNDTTGNFRTEVGNTTGRCVSSTTSWSTWDPKLSRAYFNMLMAATGSDPGSAFHNFDYLAELLYDSAQDLNGGAAVTYVNGATYTLTRP